MIERKNEDGTWPRQASHPKCVCSDLHLHHSMFLPVSVEFLIHSFVYFQVQYSHIQDFYNFTEAVLQFLCHHFFYSDQWRQQQQQLKLHAKQQHLFWNQVRLISHLILFSLYKYSLFDLKLTAFVYVFMSISSNYRSYYSFLFYFKIHIYTWRSQSGLFSAGWEDTAHTARHTIIESLPLSLVCVASAIWATPAS